MGSTLTNTQPKDTYKGILKTSDTTELSATAKYVSDGNGNDSALAISTSNIGIGTNDPQAILNGFSTSARGLSISNSYPFIGLNDTDGGRIYLGTQANTGYLWNNGASDFIIATNAAERMRILAGGGLTFNGDTSANNALNDYEIGTFTPTMGGATFSLTIAQGFYTKIGRQVSIYIDVEGTYSSPTATFYVNLPFNVLGGSRGEGVVRPISGMTFTNYVTCEAVSTSLFFEDCYPSTGSASIDMNSSNFNSAGFRFFAQTSFFV